MLERGLIATDEAANLLEALDRETESQVEVCPQTDSTSSRPTDSWARFWIYPFLAGVGLLALGITVVAAVYSSSSARGWLVCGWLPLLSGLTVMLLAWWARQATWLHVRVQEEGRRKVAFSLPLPLTLAAWALRVAQPFVPQLGDTGVDDLIIALRDSKTSSTPLSIDVQDDEAGERVQLYFG
jgi:hypothetical protein